MDNEYLSFDDTFLLKTTVVTFVVSYIRKKNAKFDEKRHKRELWITFTISKSANKIVALNLKVRNTAQITLNFTPTIFFNLSQSFDTIVHPKLMYKLKYHGFENAGLILIRSYLDKRAQYVKIGETKSHRFKFRVPQISTPRHLLFKIFKNDLKSSGSLFDCVRYPDDSTLLSIIEAL